MTVTMNQVTVGGLLVASNRIIAGLIAFLPLTAERKPSLNGSERWDAQQCAKLGIGFMIKVGVLRELYKRR
jgi:hypothetical protein